MIQALPPGYLRRRPDSVSPVPIPLLRILGIDPKPLATSRRFLANAKPGPPPVAAPERSNGTATGGRAEALVGRFFCVAN